MAHRLRESREERNRRRRGRGSGSCGSHFIKQPRTRQRCSFRRINKKSEFTEQNHAVKCNHKLHHDYNRVQSHIQMVALGLSCHQYFTISTLQAATSSGYSTHYHPPLFFLFLILHRSLCLYDKLALCSTTTRPWHYWAFYEFVCVSPSLLTR